MQNEQGVNAMQEPVIPFGATCTTTRRIVIVSPIPSLLHELVRELTTECYDVMVFHHLDENAVARLSMDLLIVDMTMEQQMPLAELDALALAVDAPAYHLVRPGSRRAADARTILWRPAYPGDVKQRIQSVLQNQQPSSISVVDTGAGEHQLVYKDLTVDTKRMTVSRGRTRIDLTKTEFDLLHALIAADGAVLSRQQLMDQIWGEHYFGGSNTLDVHMKSLRQKLKDNPKAPSYIATVRGVGYRLADG
ncbi:winged helix-turn-helix transcriptional regulator [Paenibacillus cremeus]|nr:winged-helix domain-containing protein [Paenibacillus cremeus]